MHAVKHQMQGSASELRWSEAREARTRDKATNIKTEGKCEESKQIANEPLAFIRAQSVRGQTRQGISKGGTNAKKEGGRDDKGVYRRTTGTTKKKVVPETRNVVWVWARRRRGVTEERGRRGGSWKEEGEGGKNAKQFRSPTLDDESFLERKKKKKKWTGTGEGKEKAGCEIIITTTNRG